MTAPAPVPRAALALLFLKLGVIAFGGPAAHVALMRREVVERRHWVAEDEFLQMFAACNLIPGPSSTELAIYLGYRLGGPVGLVLAGGLFIVPAMLIMLGLAAGYQHAGSTHAVAAALNGIRPVVVGIVVWALSDLGRRILTQIRFCSLAGGAFVLALLGLNPILVLVLAGTAGVLLTRPLPLMPPARGAVLVAGNLAAAPALIAVRHADLATLFLTFLKLGAVSYGSGYVLFAFLHADFVAGLHWLTDAQLTDVVAIGQATPGPVFTTATFLGYLFGGVPGALLATLGIFLPGFVLVPFLDRIVGLVNAHAAARGFLAGVNAGALGLIAAVTLALARASLHDPFTIVLAVVVVPVLLWRPLASPALIAFGAVAGIVAAR